MENRENWSALWIDMGQPEENALGYRGTPLGNGLFAAKENGGVREDIFQLNHSTFWSGDPQFRECLREGREGYGNSREKRREAYGKLVSTLKQAYRKGISQSERDSLMRSLAETTRGLWEADLHSAFLPVGQLKLTFPELTDTTAYKRILNLDRAASEVSFRKNGVTYRRETFISNPDKVMVIRITNEKGFPMKLRAELVLPAQMEGKSRYNRVAMDFARKEIVMTERAPYDFGASRWDEERGILLEARAKVVLPKGGNLYWGETFAEALEAPEIVLLYTCETSFRDVFTDPSHSGIDYSGKVITTMDNALHKSYEELKERHREEYRELFRRFWIELGGSSITAGNGAEIMPFEYARHYQYGRYINIACERADSVMPQGLLGMWSAQWKGPNEGAYFLNENMEKMQLLKGAANLQDSSDCLYCYISSWAAQATGQKTAKEIYGAEDGAWMMGHSTGIWAKTGMWGETVEYGSWLFGGIWALESLYDKYEFTMDPKRLQKYYPLLEGAAKFALSLLTEVDGVEGELEGCLVVAPAGSPEHWFWVGDTKVAFDIASACDSLLCRNLFNMLKSAGEEMKKAGFFPNEALLDRVREAEKRLMPLEMMIDRETGCLKEWYNEYPVGDKRHRHASHLLGLFLNHIDINEKDTPELYAAQRREMERWMLADGGTHPDRSVMAVRAGFPDFAFANLTTGIVGTGYGHDEVMRWTAVAGSIGEAIVDSRFGQIRLLEHLPAAWSSGTVKGIRARGGFRMNIVWEQGELVRCVIGLPGEELPEVFYRGKLLDLQADERIVLVSVLD
jgi:hypothetical protein